MPISQAARKKLTPLILLLSALLVITGLALFLHNREDPTLQSLGKDKALNWQDPRLTIATETSNKEKYSRLWNVRKTAEIFKTYAIQTGVDPTVILQDFRRYITRNSYTDDGETLRLLPNTLYFFAKSNNQKTSLEATVDLKELTLTVRLGAL